MSNFFNEMISGSNGRVSSKRLIAIVSTIIVFVITFVDLFTVYQISEFIFDGLMYIIIGGLGFVASEKFADAMAAQKSGKSTSTYTSTTESSITPDKIEGA